MVFSPIFRLRLSPDVMYTGCTGTCVVRPKVLAAWLPLGTTVSFHSCEMLSSRAMARRDSPFSLAYLVISGWSAELLYRSMMRLPVYRVPQRRDLRSM